MKITDEQRSMIASAFVGAFEFGISVDDAHRRSLCCASDKLAACARIVGKRKADALADFFYEELGCYSRHPEDQAEYEQYFLDKIAALETL